MDNIDITDSTFSLGMSDVNNIVSLGGVQDNTAYIYIGIGILLLFIAMFAYKMYLNRKSSNDCQGGFCTMNDAPNHNNQ